MQQQDPILAALARIEAKQDEQLKNQEHMDAQLDQIHADCRRTAVVAGVKLEELRLKRALD